MVSRRSITALSILAIAAGALFVFADHEWQCGTTIGKRSAGQIGSPGRVKHIAPIRVQVQSHGTIRSAKRESTMNETPGQYERIELPGLRKYQFSHTAGVTRYRIRSDAQVVYDGPPVARPAAKLSDSIEVDFDWNDESASVTVNDRCSIRSNWNWLVKRYVG